MARPNEEADIHEHVIKSPNYHKNEGECAEQSNVVKPFALFPEPATNAVKVVAGRVLTSAYTRIPRAYGIKGRLYANFRSRT